jgi:hypothetical protein
MPRPDHGALSIPPAAISGLPTYRPRLEETSCVGTGTSIASSERADTQKSTVVPHPPAHDMRQKDSRRNRRLSFCSHSDKVHIQPTQWEKSKWIDKIATTSMRGR